MNSSKVTFGLFAILMILGFAWIMRDKYAAKTPAEPAPATSVASVTPAPQNLPEEKNLFFGIKGETRDLTSGKVEFEESQVTDGKAHFYNTQLPNGQNVFYFLVKSPDGKLRAAANGCQVCGRALQGFHQEGEFMVCNTCGNRYHLNQVATEKGGCNPAPINPALTAQASKVVLTEADLSGVQQYFVR